MNAMTEKAATEVIKRTAMHVAASMIHGEYAERERAWDMAREVDDEVGGFIELVKRSIQMLGQDPERVWIIPVEIVDDKPQVNMQSARWRLARHIAGAYVSGSNEQFERAKELERELAQAGLLLVDTVNEMVLDAMREAPRNRGEHGRVDSCPF